MEFWSRVVWPQSSLCVSLVLLLLSRSKGTAALPAGGALVKPLAVPVLWRKLWCKEDLACRSLHGRGGSGVPPEGHGVQVMGQPQPPSEGAAGVEG